MIYQNYNLNLIPGQVPLSVWCSQYDKDSRTFRFTIYKGGELFFIPSGSTVSVRGTKQDNTGFEYSCTFDGTVVEVIVKDQMTIFAGKVPCEIRIANGSDIIGTANFNLMVEHTPLDTDVTISETDLPLLEEAEQNAIRAENAADQAETVLASAVKSVNNVLPDANGNVDVNGALPSGGTQGQVLTKQSATYGDVAWDDIDALPTGGTQGQVLTKQSSQDGDADWEDIQALPSGGTQGQYLVKSSATEGDADWQTKEVELTQAQYDALPNSKLTDGVSYYITDGESAPSTNRFSADGISYGSGSVADALDTLNSKLGFTCLDATLNANSSVTINIANMLYGFVARNDSNRGIFVVDYWKEGGTALVGTLGNVTITHTAVTGTVTLTNTANMTIPVIVMGIGITRV